MAGKKTKIFDLDSKQLPESTKTDKKEATVRDQRSAEKEIEAIRQSNDANIS